MTAESSSGRVTAPVAIGIAGALAAAALAILLFWQAPRHVATAGFWFDDVTFELPPAQTARLGGAIDEQARRRIRSVARSELRAAFSGLRIEFSEDRGAFYRVRVTQQSVVPGAAGQSHVLMPLGGQGSVGFATLASQAIAHAPPDADRETIIEGIGRGIGRAAVHEFAHQILAGVNLHAGTDDRSYEYASADRPAQYYGEMHWTIAWSRLEAKLGTRPRAGPP